MKTKVFITGMGAMSSLGNNVETMFEGLLENKSGVVQMPEWKKYKGLNTFLSAPVPKYESKSIARSARRTMSAMSEMATIATIEALAQAGITLSNKTDLSRAVMCMGCSGGSPETFEDYFRKLIERGGPEGQMGTTFFKVMNHTVPTNVAAALGFEGPVFSASSACATSAQSMILGWELIQSGLYDVVIAGGADELHYTTAAVFDVVFAASRGYYETPEKAPRPFDKDRDGLVVSEGAGVVILESEKSVMKRGAKPLAIMEAGAYICSGAHMSQNNAAVMERVMRATLERAGLESNRIEYINAHATATKQGDQEEAEAIGQVFGKTVPVSSLKGHMGHSLAACGALEAIASVKMMEKSILIPTRNLDHIDPACDQIQLLQHRLSKPIQTVLSNNFAFGGINTSLILSRI